MKPAFLAGLDQLAQMEALSDCDAGLFAALAEHQAAGACPEAAHPAAQQATKMVEVTQEDANNYCRVLSHLGIEDDDTDPVVAIQMVQSWEADAQARAELLEQHLCAVLEVARTWQPDYATKMDRDTLQHAQDCVDRKTPQEPSHG